MPIGLGFVFKEGMLVITAGPSVGDLSLKEESPFSPPRAKYVPVSFVPSFLIVIPPWLVMCNVYSESKIHTKVVLLAVCSLVQMLVGYSDTYSFVNHYAYSS